MALIDLFHLHRWGEWKLVQTVNHYSEWATKDSLPTKIVNTYTSVCTSCGDLGVKKVEL